MSNAVFTTIYYTTIYKIIENGKYCILFELSTFRN